MSDSQQKRKFEDGASGGVLYNRVPPPVSDFELARQRAQEIVSRLVAQDVSKTSPPNEPKGISLPAKDTGDISSSVIDEAKDKSETLDTKMAQSGTPKEQSNDKLFQTVSQVHVGNEASSVYYNSVYGISPGYRKIDIPNTKVGSVIGKGGETLKYMQQQTGAKIRVARDSDHDPNSPFRTVKLVGTPEQINRAEQLIRDITSETGAMGSISAQILGEKDHMTVPTNKVALIIGPGGETIKSLQCKSGAKIQLAPIQGPLAQSFGMTERELVLAGSKEQIDAARELIKELISEASTGPATLQGIFHQQVYSHPGPPSVWVPQNGLSVFQQGYGYPPQNYDHHQYTEQVQAYGHFQQHMYGWNISPPPQYPGYFEQAQAGYIGQGYQRVQQPIVPAYGSSDNANLFPYGPVGNYGHIQ